MIGNTLRGRDDQYVAIQDEKTRTWRILDTWHESLKAADVEDDIPDDRPAVQIITESAFMSLIREASRLGIIENAVSGIDDSEYFELESQLEEKLIEIDNLKSDVKSYSDEINSLRNAETPKPILSEDTYLKEKGMDAILKITGLSDISKLSQKS